MKIELIIMKEQKNAISICEEIAIEGSEKINIQIVSDKDQLRLELPEGWLSIQYLGDSFKLHSILMSDGEWCYSSQRNIGYSFLKKAFSKLSFKFNVDNYSDVSGSITGFIPQDNFATHFRELFEFLNDYLVIEESVYHNNDDDDDDGYASHYSKKFVPLKTMPEFFFTVLFAILTEFQNTPHILSKRSFLHFLNASLGAEPPPDYANNNRVSSINEATPGFFKPTEIHPPKKSHPDDLNGSLKNTVTLVKNATDHT